MLQAFKASVSPKTILLYIYFTVYVQKVKLIWKTIKLLASALIVVTFLFFQAEEARRLEQQCSGLDSRVIELQKSPFAKSRQPDKLNSL